MRCIFSLASLRFPLAWAVMGAFALSSLADPPAGATYPAWWLDRQVVAAQPPDSEDEEQEEEFAAWMEGNYEPANLGQLKHVADKARDYLNDKLFEVGGAGPVIESMVDGWDVSSAANYAPLNLGQLKAVAEPFYERLQAVGFDTRQSLLDHGATLSEGQTFPWPAPPPGPTEEGYNETTYNAWMAQNYLPANLGQVKLVFTFDLDVWAAGRDWSSVDADDDGLPDWWELEYGFSPFDDGSVDVNNGPSGDPDGDEVSNLDEYNGGEGSTDPTDPVSGPEPPEDPPPSAPGGFLVQQVREEGGELMAGHLYLRWGTVSGNITYQVQRRSPSGVAGVPGAWGNVSLTPNITGSVATVTDAGAEFPDYYQYRVRAVDGDTSLPSAWAQFPGGLLHIQPLPPDAGEEDAEWEVPGSEDLDDDGLSNEEEFVYATSPTNPDSDGDGALDGLDAFAADRDFSLPRQPEPHYAVLDLGAGEVVDMNDAGDVLIKQVTVSGNTTTTSYRVWSGGANVTLPGQGSQSYDITWSRLGWDASSNHTIAMGATRMDFTTSQNMTASGAIPVYYDVGAEEPELEEPTYAGLLGLGGSPTDLNLYNGYDGFYLFHDRDGTAYWMITHSYTSGNTTSTSAQLASWGPGGLATADGPLLIATNATLNVNGAGSLTLTLASLPDGEGGEDTLTAVFTLPTTAEWNEDNGRSSVGRIHINGQEIPRLMHANIDGWNTFNLSVYRQLADRFARWGGKAVLALTPNSVYPENLAFQAAPGAPVQYKVLPADPRVKETPAEISQLRSEGLMITGGGGQSVNSKEFAVADFMPGSVANNCTVTAAAQSAEGGTAATAAYAENETVEKRALAMYRVFVNPIQHESFKKEGIGHPRSGYQQYETTRVVPKTSYDADEIPLDYIRNPAVILNLNGVSNTTIAEDQMTAKLKATIGSLDPKNPEAPANSTVRDLVSEHLRWVRDPSSAGNVTFINNGELGNTTAFGKGAEVEVRGTANGNVTLHLMWAKNPEDTAVGNFTSIGAITKDAKTLSNIDTEPLPSPVVRYEAIVGPEKTVTCRAQRLFFGPNSGDTRAPSPTEIVNIIRVANVYLRQAGIKLVLEDTDTGSFRETTASFTLSGTFINNDKELTVSGANTTLLRVGQDVSGHASIPSPAYILKISGDTVTLSDLPTGNGTADLTFRRADLAANVTEETTEGIFRVRMQEPQQTPIGAFGVMYSDNSDQGAANAFVNNMSVEGARKFLATNAQSKVLQIGFVGGLHRQDTKPYQALMVWTETTQTTHTRPYIASLMDNRSDKLGEGHELKLNIGTDFSDRNNILGGAVRDVSSPDGNNSHLYGVVLASYNPNLWNTNVFQNLYTYFHESYLFSYGQNLAHEVGHVLGLKHRAGAQKYFDESDTLENVKFDGKSIIGPAASNLMDYALKDPKNLLVPEDIDLGQAEIMRSSPIFN